MNKEHILSEITRTAALNDGVPLGRERFSRETGIQTHDWFGKYWARWGEALQEAGFSPNELQSAYDQNVLIERYISLARELGHLPVNAELRLKARRDDTFPSHSTFVRLRGSKQRLVTTVLAYCKGRTGYEDILALCNALPTAVRDEVRDDAELDETVGFVYLMKSGRYYKIGRSNAAGRREYELAIQMPERVITLHTIRTDDPAGIEDYWHR
jgi:hypothetical protein